MNNQKLNIKESPLFWPARLKNDALYVLDETLIPQKFHYIRVRTYPEAIKIIKQMKTRAFGQFLVVLNTFLLELNKMSRSYKYVTPRIVAERMEKIAEALNNSRPTFPFSEVTSIVVGWANEAVNKEIDIQDFLIGNINGYLESIRKRRLERVKKVARLIRNGDNILTHCNVSGELAMAARICLDRGKKAHFFATETRPYMQGAKLTSWEMKRMGVDVTLIADNAVASVISDGLINKVIVGSDRSCANGDIANKIGTYQIAVVAHEFGVPFYALTQPSNKIERGDDIPIEIRNPKELLNNYKNHRLSGLVEGFYPGFDIVPHELITRDIPIKAR